MLSVLLVIGMFSQGLSIDSRGTRFITAFPENVAYYFYQTSNYLKITALRPKTEVKVMYLDQENKQYIQNAGDTWIINFGKWIEQNQFGAFNKSVRISSNKNITVLSVSGWGDRFQSHVVQPDQNLGAFYLIPSLNYTKLVTSLNLLMFSEPRYNYFRLLIINAVDNNNAFTIKLVDDRGQKLTDTITLGPYMLYQLQTNGVVKEINATQNVAVMLTHPCIGTKNCTCNMVVNLLSPAKLETREDGFLIPSFFDINQMLLTTNQNVRVSCGSLQANIVSGANNSIDILPLFPNVQKGSQLITTSRSVLLRLISTGLVLDLIPVSMFSACYLIHFQSSGSFALVIARTSKINDVRMSQNPLPQTTKWNVVTGTEYSWAIVKEQSSQTIWHPTSKIGVYMIERIKLENYYAGPALTINADPDPNGCLASPGTFIVGENKMSWAMSRQYCLDNADQFATLLQKETQEMMETSLLLTNREEGWISLRRNLFTTEWYWRNDNDAPPSLKFSCWDKGQPEKPDKGLCASVLLDPKKNFMWKSDRCCTKKKPVCYNNPIYLTLGNTI